MQLTKRDIKNLLKKDNPIIFEIGCADGIDTKEFLDEFGENLIIYCFEPDERNTKTFLNGGFRPINPKFTEKIEGKNLFFFQKAVGNVDGLVEFNTSSTIYSSSLKKPMLSLFETWSEIKFEQKNIVECIKLDSFVNENKINLIDFIWADVQGAEDFLIEGGIDTFETKVRFFYTEYSDKEYYEKSPNQYKILELLGDNWELIKDYGSDILLRNKNL